MDLAIVTNNRWILGGIPGVIQEWTRRKALPIRKDLAKKIRATDLAFIWDGHVHELVAFAEFQGGELKQSQDVALRSARGYCDASAIVYSVQVPEATLSWTPQWLRGQKAFTKLEATAADQLLHVVDSNIVRDIQPYDKDHLARLERTIRDEVLSTLDADETLRRAWHEWRNAAEKSEESDSPNARRPLKLPEDPQEADVMSLAIFYIEEALAPLTALELAAEEATRIEGELVISSRPEAQDELNVSRILTIGRSGLFDQARLLRRVLKPYARYE